MSAGHGGGAVVSGRRDRFYQWLLLTGDRTVIIAALTAATFLITVAVTGGYLPRTRGNAVPVLRLSTALAGGLLPFITLVLTINQIALPMELGSVFHLDRRLDSMREFRGRVAELTDRDTCPAEPPRLLWTLFDGIQSRVPTLTGASADAVADYGETLRSEAATVQRRLSGDVGMFDALVATRRYNPGGHVHEVESLRGAVEADREPVLDDLVALHEHLDVAQKFFWMIYIEDEMATLARHVLYSGFVGLAAGIALTVGMDRLLILGIDGWRLTLAAGTGITLEILPFAILFAHMLRIATVARTSSGFGPFVTEGPGWD